MGKPAPNIGSIFQLTPVQEGILFHVEAAGEGDSTGRPYVQQFTCRLRGEVDPVAFQAAWQAAAKRHAPLRTFFTWRGRPHPLQVVRQTVAMPVEILEDARLLPAGADELEDWLAADRARGFDLEKAPLSRAFLMRDGSGAQRMVWTFHHLILDGWSMRIVLDEVLRSVGGEAPPVGEPGVTQESFVAWQRSQDPAASREHWRSALSGVDGPTRIAADSAVISGAETTYGEIALRLDGAETAALAAMARKSRVTQGACLRAAWAATLSAFSGDGDVVFGATVAGRAAPLDGIERGVGMFINTVPVRVRVAAEGSLAEWIRGIQEDQLSAVSSESMGLSEIRRETDVPAGVPLFETILVVENHATGGQDAPRIEVLEPRYIERSNYALALLVVPGDELELICVHDGARVAPAIATAMLEMAARCLRTLGLASGEAPVGALLEAPDREPPIRSPWPEPAELDVVRSIARWATSDDAAVCTAGETWSHRALHGRALAIAGGLVREGVAPGDRVAVQLERGPEAIACIVGILYAGAAYVPVDPGAPEVRREAILRLSGARLLLDDATAIPGDGDSPEALSEPVSVAPESLAYVLFTSGSTGEPKGVQVSRRSLSFSTSARSDVYAKTPLAAGSRFLLLSPLHFDSSVAGLFWALHSGAALVLPGPREERDPGTLIGLIQRFRVTHTLLLPSLLDALLEGAATPELASVSCVIVAGEACPEELPQSLADRCPAARLWNEYGPTEATVWATAQELAPGRAVTIGLPIGGSSAYVLGPGLLRVPRGITGELCLGGPGLAVGYAGDAELTKARFPAVDLVDEGPTRVYRTGDRVRVSSGGELVFLGRIDDQVKIRGHRVELAEVEAGFAASPLVEEVAAIVVPGPAGRGERLVVYLTSTRGEATPDRIMADAATRLSGAMLPSSVELVESLPRTPSGKVDRRALKNRPAPEAASVAGRLAPRSDVESKLHGIWCEVLGLESISVEANFFELGGDSLLSIRILSRAHKAGIEITPAEFHDRPTIEGLAQVAAARAASDGGSSASAGVSNAAAGSPSGEVPLTPIQRWFFRLDLPERRHWNLARVVELEGHPLDVERLRAALFAVVQRHDALRLRFNFSGTEPAASIGPPSDPALEVVELDGLSSELRNQAVEEAALCVQSGFDLAQGPLLAAAAYQLPPGEGPSKLLLAVHHLAVDAVSWGTLVDDLKRAYGGAALSSGGPGPLSGPWASWAAALDRAARSEEVGAEAEYWVALAAEQPTAELFSEFTGQDPVAGEQCFEVALSESSTRALLEDVPSVYSTRIMDSLLCALERAMVPVAHGPYAEGRAPLMIDVESHGRQRLGEGPDPSEMVGWFTCVWPFALRPQGASHGDASWSGKPVGDALKSVKERLRAVPNGGLGFGLLAEASPRESVRGALRSMGPRAVLFNYLGRLDGDPVGDAEWTGELRSRLGQRAYSLEINAWVAGGALCVRWAFGAGFGDGASLRAGAAAFLGGLESIVQHCADPKAGGKTLSDFPLAGLDQASFDRLSDLLGED